MADVYGVPMTDMDEIDSEFTPFEAVVILKGFDGDGSMNLVVIVSDGIPNWELLGMAETLREDAKSLSYLTTSGEDDEL